MSGPLNDSHNRIEVDLRGLREFANALRADVDNSLKVVTPLIIHEHSGPVPFGMGWAGVSSAMDTARESYFECLTASQVALDSYVKAAERLIAAALAVAQQYVHADDLAAAKGADINRILMGAATQERAAGDAASGTRNSIR